MTVKAYPQGHEIEYNKYSDKWVYSDTKESAIVIRECTKCGL